MWSSSARSILGTSKGDSAVTESLLATAPAAGSSGNGGSSVGGSGNGGSSNRSRAMSPAAAGLVSSAHANALLTSIGHQPSPGNSGSGSNEVGAAAAAAAGISQVREEQVPPPPLCLSHS
jgi:hypothetical protein